jgi:drug/metabolite transporter (DMT)-like permease
MQTKTIGIVMTVLGVLMLLYNSFNYVTTEKVVDLGPIQINKEVNHPVEWSPIVGIVLAIGGVLLIVINKNKNS